MTREFKRLQMPQASPFSQVDDKIRNVGSWHIASVRGDGKVQPLLEVKRTRCERAGWCNRHVQSGLAPLSGKPGRCLTSMTYGLGLFARDLSAAIQSVLPISMRD